MGKLQLELNYLDQYILNDTASQILSVIVRWYSCFHTTRGDPEIRGKRSAFLHRLANRAENLTHTTATHMQLICHSMNYVTRLRALQLSSR